ncbi:hypothetical protein B0T22DRAFT_539092 [Podospora appendiculata]|uniref:Uncharacterized protein n=1 Tax=Podospora appendiculata TaxID=314037 RepID=A0AAE1C9I6_9PEZI|nr:hypothetical protein B0T22DRAFT_539092 [Podospora appendiculata]
MAGVEEFNIPVPFVDDPEEQGTNRTYLGNPLFQLETSGFTSTVTEQYVLHGRLTKEDETPASLVIVHFSLHRDSRVGSRRFRKVTIGLTFTSASGQPSEDPAIRCFAPAQDGNIGVIPTTVLRQSEREAKGSAKLDGGAIAPVSLGFVYGRKDQSQWDEHLLAIVSAKSEASSRTRDREGYNVVKFTITENHAQKQIPDSYQLAVVLERKNNEPFLVKAKVDASVDALYSLAGATKSLIGLKQPVKTYHPAAKTELGKLDYPEDAKVDSSALGLLVNGRELDNFAYVHVVEQVTPVSLYGGTQPADRRPEAQGKDEQGGQDGQGGDEDPQVDSGAKTNINLTLQLGGDGGKDEPEGASDNQKGEA